MSDRVSVPAHQQLELLKRGVVDLVSEAELLERLLAGTPLRVKAGFDPTRPDLHLGHAVLINKLKQFQDLGHTVVFIVGDFTAQVGDPTGRNKARPPLTKEEVLAGARTYAEQAFKILDPARTEVRYNSEWLDKLSPSEIVKLTAKRTVARTMERRDFRERWEAHQDIYLHEFLYPLFQGYDSVAIKADIELGGTDQLFNLNVGRDLMSAYDLRPQMVMTLPLLEGIDARFVDGRVEGDKMSKSADNYVGVNEAPLDMFRKLLLVNDGVVFRYFELLSEAPAADVTALKQRFVDGAAPTREAQRVLAREMVARFHGDEAMRAAEARYDANRQGVFPPDAPAFTFAADATRGTLWIAAAMKQSNLAESSSAARPLVKSGAVPLDGRKLGKDDEQLQLEPGRTYELMTGGKNRRYARVSVTPHA